MRVGVLGHIIDHLSERYGRLVWQAKEHLPKFWTGLKHVGADVAGEYGADPALDPLNRKEYLVFLRCI